MKVLLIVILAFLYINVNIDDTVSQNYRMSERTGISMPRSAQNNFHKGGKERLKSKTLMHEKFDL